MAERMTNPSVDLEQVAGADVVTPQGDLDVFSAGRLRSVVFDPSTCSQGALVLDLSAIDFIDSTGLGVLVATRRWTRARAAELVIVVRPGSVVARLLALAGLEPVFTTVATRDEALASVVQSVAVGP
jgi:anti-sigma B factor antagonist